MRPSNAVRMNPRARATGMPGVQLASRVVTEPRTARLSTSPRGAGVTRERGRLLGSPDRIAKNSSA
jgi:hypothetical protein